VQKVVETPRLWLGFPRHFLFFQTVLSCFYNAIETNLFHFLTIAGLYHLAIKTGDETNAGTDANVWVQVYGDKGDTGHVQLKKSGMMENLFERGQTDYFTLEAGDVGKVTISHID